MPRPTILTSIASKRGWTLVVVREHGPTYVVGLLSSHLRPVPLEAARYATYGEAVARMEAEAQARRGQDIP